MVHKEQYQRLADAAAMERSRFASHIGKIGDDTFVYSLLTADSAEFDPDKQTIVTVKGDEVNVLEGDAAKTALAQTDLREFSTGRAIYKKYRVLVKNGSAIIGEEPGYAQAIVEALTMKRVKPSVLYQYLELAEHYRKKLRIAGNDIQLY